MTIWRTIAQKTWLVVLSLITCWALLAGLMFLVFLAPVLENSTGPDYVTSWIVFCIILIMNIVGVYGLIKGRKMYRKTKILRPSSSRICLGLYYAILMCIIIGIGYETGAFAFLNKI